MLGIAKLAVAVFTPGQWQHTGFFNVLEQGFAYFAMNQGIDGRIVGHQEGQGKQVQLFYLGRPVDGRAYGHVDQALANRGEFAGLVALYQRCAGIDLDVDTPVGTLAHQLGPDLGALTPRKGSAYDDGQFVFGFIVGGISSRSRCKGSDRARDGAKQGTYLHGYSFSPVKALIGRWITTHTSRKTGGTPPALRSISQVTRQP